MAPRPANSAAPDLLNARLIKTAQGSWTYVLTVGRLVATSEEADEPPNWINGLHYASTAQPVTLPSRNTATSTSQIFKLVRPVKVITYSPAYFFS